MTERVETGASDSSMPVAVLREIDRQLLALIAERDRLREACGLDVLATETADGVESVAEAAASLGLGRERIIRLWHVMDAEAGRGPELPSSLAASAMRIDHVTVAVRDLDEAIAIYRDRYGFVLSRLTEQKGEYAGMLLALMEAGPVQLVLVQGTNERSQVNRFIEHHGPGVQHIAIEVGNIEAVANDLRQRGLSFLSPIIKGPGLDQIFSARDSSTSLQIELVQRNGNASFEEGNIQQLFRSMEAVDAY